MHRHWLDHSAPPAAGPLQRAPAGAKMAVAIGLVILLVATRPSWPLYAAVATVLAALALASRVPAGTLARRMILAEPFVLGVAVLALFQPGGLHAFAALLVRSTLCVAALVLLSATTPFADMLAVLRRIRVPGLMVTTLMLMHRYLYVLSDESRRMRTGRASRTFARPSRAREWRGLAGMLSNLFVRASTRSERIYAAMCSRGWR